MPSFDSQIKDIYLNKPECVVEFPDWLLPSERIDEYRAMPKLAIVEIAGRDSVAAAVKSVEEESLTDLLPTYAYTGTEHGPWSSVAEAVNRLSKRLPEIRVHRTVVLGSPRLWQALNGRYITELIEKYGFYAPCVGCHVYLHSVRVPLSIMLGKVPIISGERERHNGNIKANQIPEALDFYQSMTKEFGVELMLPLRQIAEGDRITDILGIEWPEGKEQLECVLSGNYRQLGGSSSIPAMQIVRYLEEFAMPCTKKIIGLYVTGIVPNHLEIAGRILGS